MTDEGGQNRRQGKRKKNSWSRAGCGAGHGKQCGLGNGWEKKKKEKVRINGMTEEGVAKNGRCHGGERNR